MPEDYKDVNLSEAEDIPEEVRKLASTYETIGDLYKALKRAQSGPTKFRGMAGARGILAETLEEALAQIEKKCK